MTSRWFPGFLSLAFTLGIPAGRTQEVTCTVDATCDGPIIPVETYGVNEVDIPGTTVNRHGGNRQTGFNWENNASNAGNDYQHSSDSYLGNQAGIGDSQGPGALLDAWMKADQKRGMKSIVTLPLAGYVAADMGGSVTKAQTAPSARWKRVVLDEPGVQSRTPDPSDGVVYLAEMVRFLTSKYGPAERGGVAAYSLDNEPALWPSTHPRIHPAATGYHELASQGIAAATMATTVDPTAQIYGPVLFGWPAYENLRDAPDSATFQPTYATFADYYLAEFKQASDRAGRRLLHRFDMHWYPEARGDQRIVGENTLPTYGSDLDIEARLQAPRSLWDPAYVEKSWITHYRTQGKAIRLLPRLQESVARFFPGTGLALTEYNFGGADHISGGVAQADVLGILGRYQAAGCFWPIGKDQRYIAAAFQLYRDFDGQGARFGSISLPATCSDDSRAAVHAARVNGTTLTIIAINRSRIKPCLAHLEIKLPAGQTISHVKVYRLAAEDGAHVQPLSTSPVLDDTRFADTLPAISAQLYEVRLKAQNAPERKPQSSSPTH